MGLYASQLAEIDSAGKGRVGPKTHTTEYDVEEAHTWTGVQEDPRELATLAGYDLGPYALSRCTASEYASRPSQYLLAAAEIVRNHARAGGWKGVDGVFKALTHEKVKGRLPVKGRFGEQHGRYASTRLDPTSRDIVCALIVLDEKAPTDLMRGATSWFEPTTQDEGSQGKRKLQYDAVGIVEKWGREGMEWIGPVENINAYVCMAFKYVGVGKVNIAPALAQIDEGRRGRVVKPETSTPPPVAVDHGGAAAAALAGGIVGTFGMLAIRR